MITTYSILVQILTKFFSSLPSQLILCWSCDQFVSQSILIPVNYTYFERKVILVHLLTKITKGKTKAKTKTNQPNPPKQKTPKRTLTLRKQVGRTCLVLQENKQKDGEWLRLNDKYSLNAENREKKINIVTCITCVSQNLE